MKEEGNEEEQERTVLFELRWHEDQTHGNKQTHIKEGSFKESLKKREKKGKKKKKHKVSEKSTVLGQAFWELRRKEVKEML